MGESNSILTELVEQAQGGDVSSLETLSQLVRERLYPYARRVLLDHDKSEDVVQDVLITILQSLETLKQPNRFWSWAFAITTNKIRERHRRDAVRRTVSLCEVGDGQMYGPCSADSLGTDVADRLSRRELAERTQEALRQLTDRHRMVLALRFYENMPHSDIAGIMGCSELNARVTFFQAKRALVSKLRHMGIDKAALGLALAAFGHLTLAPNASAACVAVNSAAIGEGLITGLLTAKLKFAGLMVAAIGVGAAVWSLGSQPVAGTQAPRATGLHFVHQSLLAQSEPLDFQHTQSQGAYEQWFQFPQGFDGPFMFRIQRWDPKQEDKLCWWVENEQANYYVHSGKRVVYVNNAHLTNGNYSTRVLPSDSQEFCAFIQEMEGGESRQLVDGPGLEHERDPATGRLVRRVDRRFGSLGPFETVYEYAEQPKDLFSSPAGLPVEDERDAMHKRGWTLFQVSGQLSGQGVVGAGRIPFTLGASRTHPAWIQLMIAGKTVAQDDSRNARVVLDGSEQSFAGGSLFRGLARPWAGFHTMDTIRRDAARERIWFHTKIVRPDEVAEIEVRDTKGATRYLLRYRVDIAADLLESVQFWMARGDGPEEYLGTLSFSYAQELSGDTQGDAPDLRSGSIKTESREGPGMLWPARLAEAAVSTRSHP